MRGDDWEAAVGMWFMWVVLQQGTGRAATATIGETLADELCIGGHQLAYSGKSHPKRWANWCGNLAHEYSN